VVRVVLVGTRNPLNIGAAVRALSNFGFTDLVMVQPYDASWRDAKSAMGGKGLMATARVLDTVQEAVADCALVVGTASVGSRLLKLPVRRLEYGARLIRRHPGQVALLFGSEKTGLSNDDLSLCHWLLRIPTGNEHESMNLGQAVAVCAYELNRDVRASTTKPQETRRIAASELDRIEERLFGLLETSGYTQPKTAGTTRLKLRRLLRRMNLLDADAEVLLGMLRQIAWRIGTSPDQQ
jgi:TrmH family RNA methyltransferase